MTPQQYEHEARQQANIRLLTANERRKCRTPMALIVRSSILGGIGMSLRQTAIAAAALSFAALASAGLAKADDLPLKAEKKAADLPFFLLNDNRLTYSYIFSGTDPGVWTLGPNGSIDGKTAK